MYRRLFPSLPKDPIFPTDLPGLGFQISNQNQLHSANDPKQQYLYKITNNERYNQMHRERVYDAVRNEIEIRLQATGFLQRIYLPHLTSSRPPSNNPHVPIYCSSNLQTASRVLVVSQGDREDWLIWSRSSLTLEGDIWDGSVLGLAKAVQDIAGTTVGLIVLNPCQGLYSYNEKRAMSSDAWEARVRPSFVHPAPIINDVLNKIPGNRSAQEHLAFVFQKVIGDAQWVNPQARIDIVGINKGCEIFLHYLQDQPETSSRIAAVALANCPVGLVDINQPELLNLLARRGRTWMSSDLPEDSVAAVPKLSVPSAQSTESENESDLAWERVLCPKFSAGKLPAAEDAFAYTYHKILDWFKEVGCNDGYQNPRFVPVVNASAQEEAAMDKEETQAWAAEDKSWA